MAKDFKIDPETGEVKYAPSALTLLRKLNDKEFNEFFRKSIKEEMDDPELKRLHRQFNKIKKELADLVRQKYLPKK